MPHDYGILAAIGLSGLAVAGCVLTLLRTWAPFDKSGRLRRWSTKFANGFYGLLKRVSTLKFK